MFSGTLVCGSCGREIMLMRSADKYKVMGCINGHTGKHGCKLSATKSTRIIENCLLGFLQTVLFTDEAVGKLVVKANDFLAREASKPCTDTVPLKARIREKEAAIKRLFQRIEGQDDECLCQAYERRIGELQKEVNELKKRLHAANTRNAPPPPPLDLAATKAQLANLRGLLNQEIPAAAEAIRALTGLITIRQEKIPGKKRGAKWIASFSPDLLGWLRCRPNTKDYPDSVTLEYLSTRNWITAESVQVSIDHVPKYEQIAETARSLADKGNSVETISRSLGVPWETVRDAIRFARTANAQRRVTEAGRRGRLGGQSGPRRKP